jgi:uncharacterized damage-inducible protein DinB
MDALASAFLESWGRNCNIVNRLAAEIDESLLDAAPSDGEWSIAFHLCHIHEVRYSWLREVSPEHAAKLGDLFIESEGDWTPTRDLPTIRAQLKLSGDVIGELTKSLIEKGAKKVGPYSHPVHFVQHMIWHDGWHYGLIALAMRRAGREPSEEWEEQNVWGIWRS